MVRPAKGTAMITLGVSVYPDIRPLEEIAVYLVCAARHGFTRVFSSMFSVDGTPREVLELFKRLNDVAHELGMEVSLDVNPACMRRLGATPHDLTPFARIGADILRMDGAYGEDENLVMLNNPYGMKIEYNASALKPRTISALCAAGAPKDRILACHNFYPQRYTGFAWDKFRQVNTDLSRAGIRVGAFISSHAKNTHGVWDARDGLPTVERLRDLPSSLQARLVVAGGATEVFFGNAYASEAELAGVREALDPVVPHYLSEAHEQLVAEMASFMSDPLDYSVQKKICVEPVYDVSDVERSILFDYFPHVDMGDSSEWMWRSRGPRVVFADKSIEPRRYAAPSFEPGDVMVVNNNYQHYAGELQVALRPMANDGTRNLVARIDQEEFSMFDTIRDGDICVFLPVR